MKNEEDIIKEIKEAHTLHEKDKQADNDNIPPQERFDTEYPEYSPFQQDVVSEETFADMASALQRVYSRDRLTEEQRLIYDRYKDTSALFGDPALYSVINGAYAVLNSQNPPSGSPRDEAIAHLTAALDELFERNLRK